MTTTTKYPDAPTKLHRRPLCRIGEPALSAGSDVQSYMDSWFLNPAIVGGT